MVLNYLNNTMSIGKVTVNLFKRGEQSSFCLSVLKKIELKPLNTQIKYIKDPANFKKYALIQSDNLSYVKINNGLFEIKDSRVPVVIVNQRMYPMVSKKIKF